MFDECYREFVAKISNEIHTNGSWPESGQVTGGMIPGNRIFPNPKTGAINTLQRIYSGYKSETEKKIGGYFWRTSEGSNGGDENDRIMPASRQVNLKTGWAFACVRG